LLESKRLCETTKMELPLQARDTHFLYALKSREDRPNFNATGV